MAIVSLECQRRGERDFPIDKIAAHAGVCRTSVQTTLHEARRLSHIEITERRRRGRKNLTNLIKIISPAWRAWLKNGSRTNGGTGSNFVKNLSPTKSPDISSIESLKYDTPESGYPKNVSVKSEALPEVEFSSPRRSLSVTAIDGVIGNVRSGTEAKATRDDGGHGSSCSNTASGNGSKS